MDIEVRPATPEEMPAVKKVATSSVLLPPGVIPQELVDNISADMTLCAFVDGKVATSFAAWPYKIRINGESVPAACVTFVGTNPVYRRQGCLRKVITTHFQKVWEEKKEPFAVLHASQAAIYQRYGYAVVATHHSYQIAPRYIRFQPGMLTQPKGIVREFGEDENSVIDDIYQKFITNRTGYLERTRFIWDFGALIDPPPNAIQTKLVYEGAGQIQGYLIFNSEPAFSPEGQFSHRIHIKDFAWLTAEAYRELLKFFTRLDLASEIGWRTVPQDDPLPHLLLEPKMLNTKAGDGLLARVVDVAAALESRQYDGDGEVSFTVVDELCPWNAGSWRMVVENGRASASKHNTSTDMIIPVDTLAMVLFGQLTISEAMRMGRLQYDGTTSLLLADQLFKTRYKPFCADIF